MVDKQELHRGSIYHIRVRGSLDEKWADRFDGLVMASRENGETLLTGPVLDQAALQGVLGRIHNLRLPLLFVVQTGCPCSSRNCPRRGRCQECAAHHGDKGKLPYCFRERTRWDKQCTKLTEAV